MTIMTKAAVRAAYDLEVKRHGAGQAAIEATAQRLALDAEVVAEVVGPVCCPRAEELATTMCPDCAEASAGYSAAMAP